MATPSTDSAPGGAPSIQPCWSCRGPVRGDAAFCATCGQVQPPGQEDHFARLGLERRFDLDAAAVDRAYFARQRQVHPDRFARRSAREAALAESRSVSLNGAYQTLRDPLRRAAYLLELAGHPIAGDGATIADPELLAEVMERREALSEAETPAAVAAVAAEAARERAAAETALGVAFAAGDYPAARRHATRLRYLARLADEARRRGTVRAA
ncbi:Fe-S protein assembly co-chaperone HscB [Stella sp.]|uniref:Fe-S protein assembly co-chaperone HscB n=1 Tax=Stella sp. TaxID=2912054 RepID=UPI0035B045E7